MSEPFIGQIIMFGGNFPPRGWAFCEGQLLSIAQNSALFSILGTTFGGDGRTTFGLPDLRGRVPISPGTGPGLPNYRWGEKGGVHQMQLTAQQLPAHNHTVSPPCNTGDADHGSPAGHYPAGAPSYATTSNSTTMAASNTSSVGNNQTITNMPPFTGIYYIIALIGTFPSRN